MQVTVSYFGQARRLATGESESVNVEDGATPEDILNATTAVENERFRQLVFDQDGRVRRSVMLAIGDEVCAASEPDRVRDGDEMTVFSAMSGG